MLATRLVRLIETHAEQLSQGLMHKLQNDARCADLHKVPPEELRARSFDIFRNLSDWILGRPHELQQLYVEIGERRAHQGIEFSHVLYALTATKEQLWEFLEHEGLVVKPVELFGEMELFRLLDQFFDRALYYAAVGYEHARSCKTVAAA